VIGAGLATRVIQSLLFQTTPHDLTAFIAAALVLIATTAIAAWLPARRAARIDPVRALTTD
jgi:ABC-type antimicrobial peptide transport system permease subunit